MPSILPSIVIVHGAWHQSSHYNAFAKALMAAGFPKATTPQLPSAGSSPHTENSFAADVATINRAIEEDLSSDHDVVLSAHSYGGVVATEALSNFLPPPTPASTPSPKPKILGIIFLASMIPLKGESSATAQQDPSPGANWVDFSNPPLSVISNPAETFYNTSSTSAPIPEDILQAAIDAVVPNDTSCFMTPVSGAGWKHYPCGYVKCMLDRGLSVTEQDFAVGKLRKGNVRGGEEVQVREVECGHFPTIAMPEELARVVGEIVEAWEL